MSVAYLTRGVICTGGGVVLPPTPTGTDVILDSKPPTPAGITIEED